MPATVTRNALDSRGNMKWHVDDMIASSQDRGGGSHSGCNAHHKEQLEFSTQVDGLVNSEHLADGGCAYDECHDGYQCSPPRVHCTIISLCSTSLPGTPMMETTINHLCGRPSGSRISSPSFLRELITLKQIKMEAQRCGNHSVHSWKLASLTILPLSSKPGTTRSSRDNIGIWVRVAMGNRTRSGQWTNEVRSQ